MITMPGATDGGVSPSRSHQAYDYVRSGILRGDFATGVAISDVELANALSMSKTPIRQALRLLEQEGLLERGPRRQLVVRGFSPEYRQEVLDVREALERIAIRGACRVMPIDEIDYLRVGLLRQRRAAEAGDEGAFIDLDEEFHLMIAKGAGLQLVYKLLSQLRGFVRIMRLGTVRDRGHLLRVLEEHEAIVDALERRDEEAALAALSHHLHTADYALEASRKAASGPAA
jgi:GntR family transcriptional regulator, rspAB operon transcriptional repressor